MTTTDRTPAIPDHGTPVPAGPRQVCLWRGEVERRVSRCIRGQRSWDAYRDVFAPAWDVVVAAAADPLSECIGLVAGYIEWLTGEPLDREARSLVALAVRRHGKAALWGFDQAVGRTRDATMRSWYAYAVTVARRTVGDLTGGHDDAHTSTPRPC